MSFAWPLGFVLLLLLPLGLWLDGRIARRRRRVLAGFAAPLGVAAPAPAPAPRRGTLVRRRLPAVLAIAGLSVLLLGIGRPQVSLSAPRLEGTVVLVFDVSASMAATDYAPTRMEAAKAAAKTFAEQQPASVQIGIVAFSDSGIAVQPATNDQAAVLAAIDRLQPQRGTSLGAGILAALRAVDVAENPNQGYYTNRTPAASPPPVPAGSHRSAIVVLLSDGENNQSPDVATAAQTAADRGIRVDTVGIGSPDGTTIQLNGFTIHTALDAATLQQIADTTKGTYIPAGDAAQLSAAYADVDATLTVTAAEPTEVTAIFAIVGIALLVLGALASFAWLGRAP